MTNSLQNYSNKHLISIKNNFHEELRNASVGHKSSLSWIKSSLPTLPIISQGIAQAIVIGGSNFEFTTLNVVNNKEFKIVKTEKGILPTLNTVFDLINVFNKYIDHNADAVAVNFAFPLDPSYGSQNELDGIFLHGTKEHAIDGLKGIPVGQFLKHTIIKKDIPVTVANDTVCLTLSGSGSDQSALILGTGFNIGIKLKINDRKYSINLEAGNFKNLELNDTLKKIDKNSQSPGKYLLEKSVAGRYLVEQFNLEARGQNLNLELKSTKELSDLADRENDQKSTLLARHILKSSAKIIGSIIAGLYEFLDQPQQLELIIEGSLFWSGYMFTQTVREQLAVLGVNDDAINFKHIDNSSLKGAINLLLS